MSFDTPPYRVTEDEDADPVGPPPRDPVERFTAAAVEVGLIRPGDKLDQNMIELCTRVVDMCASIADQYPVIDMEEDSVGDAIRAELYD